MAIEDWVSAPAHDPLEQALDEVAQAPFEQVAHLGVGAPQPGVLPGAYQLGFAAVPSPAGGSRALSVPVNVVSTHGGAGGSTLVSLLIQKFEGSAPRDMGQLWPYDAARKLPVVLVCRTHRRGILAAQHVAAQWASGGVPGVELVGLVAIADAPGKLPRELRDRLHVVGGGLPATWQLPWVEAWRTEPPHLVESPREVRRVIDELAARINNTQ